MRRLEFACLVSATSFISGCEKYQCGDFEPSLQVGVGLNSFQDIEDGDTLETEWGSQGGQHIWVALKTKGVHLKDPRVELVLKYQELDIGEGGGAWAQWDGDMAGGQTVGLQLFYYPERLGEGEAVDDLVTLSIDLSDECGSELGVGHQVYIHENSP